VVATVRPETMLADSGVAVNPTDPRYQAYIGRRAFLPLIGRELPVVGDDYVKTDFGTGALKVTPGHDPMDYEIGQRHHLGQQPTLPDARYQGSSGPWRPPHESSGHHLLMMP